MRRVAASKPALNEAEGPKALGMVNSALPDYQIKFETILVPAEKRLQFHDKFHNL